MMSRTAEELDQASFAMADAHDGLFTAWSAVSRYRGAYGHEYQTCAFCDQAIHENEDREHSPECPFRRAAEALDGMERAIAALKDNCA